MKRNGIEYFVSLKKEGEVVMRSGTTNTTTVTIPIDILFDLTKQTLQNGVALDYVSDEVLSEIHGYL